MKDKQDLRLRDLCRGRRTMWATAWLLGALTLLAGTALLAVSGWFISAAAAAGLTAMAAAFTFDYFRPAAVIRALAIARTAGRYGERLASHNAVLALLRDLRCRFFGRLAAAPARSDMASPQMMHRLTGDIDLLDQFPLRFLMPWLWALLLQAAFAFWLLLSAPPLLVYTLPPLLVAGVLLPAAAAFQGAALARADAESGESRRNLLLHPLSILTALLLWRRWSECETRFLQADRAHGLLQLRQQRLASIYMWLQQCALAALAGLLLWQGAALVQTGILSVPLLLAMVLAVFGLNEALSPLAAQSMAPGFSAAARDRLNALARVRGPDAAPCALQPWPEGRWVLQADNITARHAGALSGADQVSFTLQSGQALLIEGRSGAGKSTLLDTLAGELAPLSGRLTVNGRDWAHTDKHQAVGYLAQQTDIFDLTLAENLRLGNTAATEEELWRALEKVCLAQWARSQPLGLGTRLGEYGAAVSGGQARRIALARLLLKPHALLLLDEPFSGLDQTTREALAAMLAQEQKNGLLIVASHQIPQNTAFETLRIGGR